MKLYNIKKPAETVSFCEASIRGSASQGGLFMPEQWHPLPNVNDLLRLPFVDRSVAIMRHLLQSEFSVNEIETLVQDAFSFPCPVRKVQDSMSVLELFHGPTLAFKDFGARFMARVLEKISHKPSESAKGSPSGQAGGKSPRAKADARPLTILTATSGDTGAAVAHAFYGLDKIEVVVLYPAGLISPLQEKLFCTLGKNVRTLRVKGTFDECQAMVKASFADEAITQKLRLTSANSINFCRLVAQICYYFEAVAGVRREAGKQNAVPVICVPCGNFGNLTAGIMAQRLGLPVKRFIAATNANDVVPLFLQGGTYAPRHSVATLANAMDVGAPNNWARIVELFGQDEARLRRELRSGSMTDERIRKEIKILWEHRYLAEPHTAIAYGILRDQLQPGEDGVFLSTAHPAKFREVVEETLSIKVDLPDPLARAAEKPLLSTEILPDLDALKKILL